MSKQQARAARSSASAAVRLVTGREIAARVANRSFVIGTIVNIAVIIGLLAVFGPSSDDGHHTTVAVTGIATSALTPAGNHAATGATHWHAVAGEAAARRQVAGKDADAALVVHGSEVLMLVRADTSQEARAAATAAVQQWATTRALNRQHVDVERLRQDVAASLPRTQSVDGRGSGSAGPGTAIGIVTILFFQLFGYGMMVAQGVVEEKSTRVVEVLLATLTPLRLMVGKVLGIGTAAVLQTAAFGAATFVAVRFAHVLPAQFPAASAILAAVGWFVLGFLFFAFLFAAAGSLVSRSEEVATAVMPVLMSTMVPYGVAVAATQDLNASWVQIVQYIPPFSMLIMPLQVSVHGAGWGANAVAALLMVAAAAGLAVLAGRVYERSILRVGSAVRWREALGKDA
ncbi:ABC transporter permease [Streptomyces mirabilis]